MGVFDDSIGPFVVGTFIQTFLLGITSLQTYNYYTNFPNDKRIYFYLVTFLLLIDWGHSTTSCYTIWYWGVEEYGNLAILADSPFSFAIDPALTGIAAICVQVFYAYRIFVVSKRKPIIPIIICSLSLIAFGFAVASTAEIFYLVQFVRFQEFLYGVSIWLALAALCDILISISLVYYLHVSKTNFIATNHLIESMIRSIAETNALTALVAVADIIAFGASKTSWHVALNLCLVKLYINSLLVSLNARIGLEKSLLAAQHLPIDFSLVSAHSDLKGLLTTASGFTAFDPTPAKSVKVDTVQTIVIDTHHEESQYSEKKFSCQIPRNINYPDLRVDEVTELDDISESSVNSSSPPLY